MVRAGMIRKVAAGIYAYLPLGCARSRSSRPSSAREMNKAGGVELLMPAIQPAELWMESGRWEQYGKELLRIKDRHEREFCFGPTHEEVITDMVRARRQELPPAPAQLSTRSRPSSATRSGPASA